MNSILKKAIELTTISTDEETENQISSLLPRYIRVKDRVGVQIE